MIQACFPETGTVILTTMQCFLNYHPNFNSFSALKRHIPRCLIRWFTTASDEYSHDMIRQPLLESVVPERAVEIPGQPARVRAFTVG